MDRRWSGTLQLQLVEFIAELPGSESESFFMAYQLGAAYHRAGKMASKKSKINSAIREAESQGRADQILTEAAKFFGFTHPDLEVNRQAELLHPGKAETISVSGKVFISHASADAELASSIKNCLLLGGVPRDRIFLSSVKSTGIPAGKNVLQHLQTTLAESALVIEVITRNFLTRPYCLMELGGAWALGKPTYPLVVPPLTIREAVHAIGNVQMGVLGAEPELDDVFDEIHEMLSAVPGISLTLRTWKEAVSTFKETTATQLHWNTDRHPAPPIARTESRASKRGTKRATPPPSTQAPEDERLEMAASELRAALKKLDWVTRSTILYTVSWGRDYRVNWEEAREAIEKRELDVDEENGTVSPNSGHPIVRIAVQKAEAWKDAIDHAGYEYAESFESESGVPLDAQSKDTWEAFHLV
ncbi:toll/interleukin-1 receptor domain-containing protein [Streptomyces sp. Tue6028]|uniref:toll/interleukin-1 receptor domain-containing protein n=1 Tax=Streptomyces sp. Tue6028 TaxID=2036037 RepID=UPI003EBA5D63